MSIQFPRQRGFATGLAVALFLLPAACTAGSEETASGTITVTDAWVRETIGAVPVSAGYARISNGTGGEVRLIAAETPRAARIEIHEASEENGIARMRELKDGLAVPPSGSVELRPGAYHMMLMDLREPIRAGEQVPVTLRFKGQPPQTVSFTARSTAEAAGGHHE